MLDVLGQISSFFFDCLRNIFTLYTTLEVLAASFVLWLLNKLFGIFDILKR